MTIFQSIEGASYRVVPDDADRLTPPLLVCATQNTWSRSARRKKAAASIQISDVGSLETQTSALKCIFECAVGGAEQDTLILEASWVQGRDRHLFESFWSHICRKLAARMKDAELGQGPSH
jgi:hypothetical protein